MTDRQHLVQLCNVAEAFLRYFNPAQLSSAKENQWLALDRQIDLARHALEKSDAL